MEFIFIGGRQYDCNMVGILEKAFIKTERTDAILLVDGKKVHVNKGLLSYHSDYFKTLFNSEFIEKSMEEIEIKDVNYVEFIMLLSLVHDTPIEITHSYVNELLKLTDQFLLRGPKLQLENFIIGSQAFSRHQKLILADKYNLEKLQEHAIGLYNNRSTFQDFNKSHNTADISDKLKLKIFDKFFNSYAYSL